MDESEKLSVEFTGEWGDYVAGEKRSLPAPAARHFVDCGVAKFIEGPAPAAESEAVVERAVKRVAKG